jgi:hypothetical protein
LSDLVHADSLNGEAHTRPDRMSGLRKHWLVS